MGLGTILIIILILALLGGFAGLGGGPFYGTGYYGGGGLGLILIIVDHLGVARAALSASGHSDSGKTKRFSARDGVRF